MCLFQSAFSGIIESMFRIKGSLFKGLKYALIITCVMGGLVISGSADAVRGKKIVKSPVQQDECTLKIHTAINKVCHTDNPKTGYTFEDCHKIGDEKTLQLITKNVIEMCQSKITEVWQTVKMKTVQKNPALQKDTLNCQVAEKQAGAVHDCILHIYKNGLDNMNLTVQNELNSICGPDQNGSDAIVVKLIQAVKGDLTDKLINKVASQDQVEDNRMQNIKDIEQEYLDLKVKNCGS